MERGTRTGYEPGLPSGRAILLSRLAAALFGLHVVLLFFPPLPPYLEGSLWSHLLGYSAVILAVFALAPSAGSFPRRWHAWNRGSRVVLGVGIAAALVVVGLGVRAASPDLFVRWTREEGVFEPVTLLIYIVASMAMFSLGRELDGRDRRFAQFFGGVFALLALEEVDYLGMVGGFVGRINGVYVGTPHDLINLVVEGGLTLPIVLMVVAIAGIVAAASLWHGYLQPLRLLRAVFSRAGLWWWTGALFLGVAALEDANVWLVFGLPRIEELLESVAALFWFCFALEAAYPSDGGAGSPPARAIADRKAPAVRV